MTEILSLLDSFSFYPVALAWSIATIISVGLALPVLKLSLKKKYWDSDKLFFDEKFLLYFIEVVLLITGLTAILSTPNTWDSMTYHLARVEHWIQNKTIAYYPSHIMRQLNYCPWAEFALAHIRLLCPWENMVNLLQWAAMFGSLVCVSLIAKQMGGSRRAQFIACLAAITLPIGILQSVSTQNDYVETFWLMCFLFFANEIIRNFRSLYLFSAGLSLGLAFLTKGVGYILAAPFLIFLIYSISGHSRKLKTIGIIIFCVVLLNAGYYERNQAGFGSISSGKDSVINSSFDLKVLTGNLLRNIGAEVDTPFSKVNKLLPLGLAKISGWLGINFSYDPKASYTHFYFKDFRAREDSSGNSFHVILFTVVILLCCFMPLRAQGLRLYTALICCAGILFCLVVRYQYWITRFHLPMFIMFCPVFGIFMERVLSPGKIIVMGWLFFLNACLYLFFNPYHLWVGPKSIFNLPHTYQYLIYRPAAHNYIKIADQIKDLGCHEIGIITGPDSWEYPLWALLRAQQLNGHFRIEHVNVTNSSAHISYPLGKFNPCAIVTIEDGYIAPLSNKQYRMIWFSKNKDGFQTTVLCAGSLMRDTF